jgi:tetratricopeptide (TPR) repeat protein
MAEPTTDVLKIIKDILQVLISWPTAVIISVVILRQPIKALTDRFTRSDFGKAKVGPFEIELGKATEELKEKASSGDRDIFHPFKYTNPIPPSEKKNIEKSILSFEPFLKQLDSKHFETLHSWYNSKNNHELALLCMDIAIAKDQNMISSRNFSYRSASLRKLIRYDEAEMSALLAIKLDVNNIDPYYNLAKIYLHLGNTDLAKKYKDKVDEFNNEVYTSNLKNFFEKKPGFVNK